MTGGRPLVRRRALMPRPRPRIPSCAHFQRNQAHPHALCRFRVKESNCTANSSALFGRSGNERSARKAVFARCGKAAPPSTRKTLQREGRKRRSGNKSGPQLEVNVVLARYGKSSCSHIGPKRQSCPAFRRDLCVPCVAGFLCHLSEVIFLAPHRAERVRDLMG